MPTYQVFVSTLKEDFSFDEEQYHYTETDKDIAWLMFVSALRENKCFADGETMAHFAWRYFGRGETVRCNGVLLKVNP